MFLFFYLESIHFGAINSKPDINVQTVGLSADLY